MPLILKLLLVISLGLCVSACSGGDKPAPAAEPIKKNALRVEVVKVSSATIRGEELYTGTLRARRMLRLHTQEGGKIIRLPFYEGERVEKGAALAELDGELLQAQLQQAEAVWQQAKLNLKRLQSLAKNKLIAEEELNRAETAQTIAEAEAKQLRLRLGYLRLTAPFSGVISERLAEPGDVVNANAHLLTVLDPNSLVVETAVSEFAFAQLKREAPAQVRIDALGLNEWAAFVLRLHPAVDPQTRQGVVEVSLKKLPDAARSGQFCRVRFTETYSVEKTIPAAALRRDRQGEYVWLLAENNIAQRAAVKSGRHFAEQVEILAGLELTQKVISQGFLGLQEGITVNPQEPQKQEQSDVASSSSNRPVEH